MRWKISVCVLLVPVAMLLTKVAVGQLGGTREKAKSRVVTQVQQTIQELREAPQGFAALPAPSGENARTLRLELPGGPQGGIEQYGEYSPSLQAYFTLRWFRMGPYTFPGAKLLSYPDPGSPLRQIGLRPGDIISRLDGVKVTSYAELDRHYANTSVRYVRYPATVRIGTIFVDADLITP